MADLTRRGGAAPGHRLQGRGELDDALRCRSSPSSSSSRPLLALFGAGYGLGATVTVILAFGKLTDVMTGPCGTMLNQAGYNKLALYDNLAALVINVGLNFALIPTYGLRAAAAWTVSLILVNAARAYQVRRYITPAWPFSEGTPKALAAFAWSVLAALVVRELSTARLARSSTSRRRWCSASTRSFSCRSDSPLRIASSFATC